MDLESQVQLISKKLKQGAIVAVQTDTVWGFIVNGENDEAVEKLYKIKNRMSEKQLIMFIAKEKQLTKYVASIPSYAKKLMNQLWPGGLTLILKTKKSIYQKQQTDTIGVRMPNKPALLAVVEAFDGPILSTSANIAGNPVLTTPSEISRIFGDDVYVWTESYGYIEQRDLPSTIVDACFEDSWEILREGSVSKEELWKIIDSDKK